MIRLFALLLFCAVGHLPAQAQQNSVEEAARRQQALQSLPADAARRLFFDVDGPARLEPRAIGLYGRGCLAGGEALAPDGPDWQVMRLSRKRNYGHPSLVAYLRALSSRAKAAGWPGLLVGDMAQARGGPMLTGHASHQLGLEADVWFTPMPERRLMPEEREEMSAVDMVRPDLLDIIPERFGMRQVKLLEQAAAAPEVDRIFVNPAIKKAVCGLAAGNRQWLRKLRPWNGHTFHFHVALKCPGGSCGARAAIPPGEGCDKDLAWWFREDVRFPKPKADAPPAKILTLADMPAACAAVLQAPPVR